MEIVYPADKPASRVVDMQTPDFILIGALQRDSNVIIPKGNTVVQPGDRLLLVTTSDRVDEVETWLEERRSQPSTA